MYGHDRSRKIVYGPGSRQIASGGATKSDPWHFYQAPKSWDVQCVFDNPPAPGVRSESNAVAMEAGHYLLRRLVVLRPCASRDPGRKGEWFDVLAHTAGTPEYLFEDDVTAFYKDPDDGQPSPRTPMSLDNFQRGVAVPSSYWSRLEGRFSVRAGQVNDWTIPLPEELI